MRQLDWLGDFSSYGPKKGKRSQQGLGLIDLVKSKEFKQRVALMKAGGKLTVKTGKAAYGYGKIVASKIGAYIKKQKGR